MSSNKNASWTTAQNRDAPLSAMDDAAPTITLDFYNDFTRNAAYYDNLRVLLAREVKFNNDVVTVGERYSRAFDFSALLPTLTTIVAAPNTAFAELGLECVVHDRRLVVQGTPRKEYDGVVLIRLVDKKDVFALFGSRLRILAPSYDAWGMWRDEPPPKNAPYQCPSRDLARDAINTDKKITVLAASVRGRSHAHYGKFREDCFSFQLCATPTGRQDPYGWHVFTVSDGAGSARYSRKGSQIVCDALTGAVSRTLNSPDGYGKELGENILQAIRERQAVAKVDDDPTFLHDRVEELRLNKFWHSVVDYAQKQIDEEVKARNLEIAKANAIPGAVQETDVTPRDFHATAQCVAIKRFRGSNRDRSLFLPTWCALTYWVGDGAIAMIRPNNTERKLSGDALLFGEPDGGEYAGETRFVTAKRENNPNETLRRAGIYVVRNFEAILMATDGVTDPFFEEPGSLRRSSSLVSFWNHNFRKTFPGVLDPSLPIQNRSEALQEGLKFQRKGYHDDRTILLLLNDFVVEQDNHEYQNSFVWQ